MIRSHVSIAAPPVSINWNAVHEVTLMTLAIVLLTVFCMPLNIYWALQDGNAIHTWKHTNLLMFVTVPLWFLGSCGLITYWIVG